MVLLELGCPAPRPPKPTPAATSAGPPAPVDAGPRPIPGARLTAVVDGGIQITCNLDAGRCDAGEQSSSELGLLDLTESDASIPDWARLTFTAAVPLEDFRARLLGSDGQLVANHAETWVADGGTQVRFLPAPLWPSRGCCRLVVDGQTDKLPTGEGSRFLPFEVDFGITPDPERPQPARPAKRHHHHRR
jgi:hypothetical protein